MIQVLEHNPSFGERIGSKLGKGVGSGLASILMDKLQPKNESVDIKKALMGQGVPEETANLISMAPKGAQSAFLKKLYSIQEPEYDDESQGLGKHFEGEPVDEEVDLEQFFSQQEPEYDDEEPSSAVFKDIDKYVSSRNEGLSAKDASALDKDRYDKNLPLFEEFDKYKESLNRNEERYNIMSSLTKKLPKGIGRINVDSDGNLRFPFLANAETQRFVKTLNEFAKGAKDTFGSRVTNFDLEQYMRTFPTLLNTEAGIKQILQQMKIVNDINKVYNNSLSDVFERSGGIRKIDYDVAKRYAEKISKPKVEALVKKFNEIGTFESLPEASQFQGKKIKNKKTGETFVSDGKEWVPQ